MMTTTPNMSSSETGRLPLTTLTEDEQMMKETGDIYTSSHSSSIPSMNNVYFLVSRLAKEQIAPVVREMEQLGHVKPDVLKMLFENGVR